jgi:hypothetical protein
VEESCHKAGVNHVGGGMVGTVIKVNRHPFIHYATIKNHFIITWVEIAQHVPTAANVGVQGVGFSLA